MCLYQIKIKPRDVLYFRDGRPIGGSYSGSGASWPLPSTFHSAMMTSMHFAFPERNSGWEWESHHTHGRGKKDPHFKTSSMRFGGLKTFGPFPYKSNEDGEQIYFPTPADVVPGGILHPEKMRGASNLPSPLTQVPTGSMAPSKEGIGSWISAEELTKYLQGEYPKTITPFELFTIEKRPGVGIDPATRANREGIFYQTEYLRLEEDVSMVSFANLESKKFNQIQGVDLLKEFFKGQQQKSFIFGGQRGTAWLECSRERISNPVKSLLPSGMKIGKYVKWILLSPGLFESGWIPGFIDGATGQVKLKLGDKDRRPDETRSQWRKRMETLPEIKAKLVAAKIDKPIVASGWALNKDSDAAGGGPKETRLLVPGGSVYYFETESEADSRALIHALSGRTMSDINGAQGFGFGICTTYNKDNN